MRCQIRHTVISDEGWSLSTGRVISKCITHNWILGYQDGHSGSLCPLGRIEQAVDEGLAKIAVAKAGHLDDRVNPGHSEKPFYAGYESGVDELTYGPPKEIK